MAEHTRVAFGDGNRGFQVGLNSGSITNQFHLPSERLETPPEPCLTIPFRRDADFVERDTLLGQIQAACSGPASRAALVGLGGVGKSQLAIEYAYRTDDTATQKNQPTWVFWIHAETRARVEEGFRSIADTAKLPGRKQQDANIPQLVEQWLCSKESGPWLLILDNADNASVLFDADRGSTNAANATATNNSRGRALSTYLPQSSHGSILITTRNKKVAEKLTGGGNSIDVPPMDKGHALALLEKKTGHQPDMDKSAALVEALEYMPLAISQAGAYIRQQAPRSSIGKYLEEFQKSERRKFSLLNRDEGDLRRDRDASNSVIVTWQISFESIRSERPSAADLLSLMSFFDRQGIPESLVRPPNRISSQDSRRHHSESGRNEEDSDIDERNKSDSESDDSSASSTSEGSASEIFEDDQLMLRNYSLITTETGDVFKMHSLVQLATRRWLSAEERIELFKEQFVGRMAREFPTGAYGNWATCQRLFAHVEGAINHRPKGGESLKEWAQILYNGSWYAQGQGRYSLAETMAKKSRDARLETLGEEHELTWDSVSMVGEVLRDQGKYKKAEKLFVEVMERSREKLGPSHPSTLTSMANLASTYRKQGRWKEAEKLQVDVMETSKEKLGLSHPSTLRSMGNLASTYWKQGRWKEAEKLRVDVMETHKEKLGPAHPDTLTSMGNLASTFRKLGRREEAEKLQVDVMETRKEKLGPSHPSTLSSMANLASTYRKQGRWEEAEKLFVEVMETRKEKLGPAHPSTLSSMNSLAFTWHAQQRATDAIGMMSSCVQLARKVLGPDHPNTVSSIKTLDTWRAEHATPLLSELSISDET